MQRSRLLRDNLASQTLVRLLRAKKEKREDEHENGQRGPFIGHSLCDRQILRPALSALLLGDEV